MSSKLKSIKINFNNITNKSIKDIPSKRDELENIKEKINSDSTIVVIGIDDTKFIKELFNYSKKKCQMLLYLTDTEKAIKARKLFNAKEIIVFNKSFEANDVRSEIVDFVLCENALIKNEINGLFLKELNRILKSDGSFVFFEKIIINEVNLTKHCGKNKMKESPLYHIVCFFRKKLKYIKNAEYMIELLGNSDLVISNNSMKSLKEFSSLLKDEIKLDELPDEINVTISGMKRS